MCLCVQENPEKNNENLLKWTTQNKGRADVCNQCRKGDGFWGEGSWLHTIPRQDSGCQNSGEDDDDDDDDGHNSQQSEH